MTDAATIERVPVGIVQEAIPSAKRKPGRPPAIDPETGERKRPARKPRTRKPSGRRPSGPKSLRAEIGAFLMMANSLVIMSPIGTRPVEAITDPNVMPERIGDELDAAEIDALAGALDAQCRRSPRFRKYVESVLGAGSGGALVTVLGIIAARRASRHGIAPPMLDPMLGMMLAGDGISALTDMPPAPDRSPDPDTGETPPVRGIDFDTNDGGAPLGMEP
jgi:hypothetical protein